MSKQGEIDKTLGDLALECVRAIGPAESCAIHILNYSSNELEPRAFEMESVVENYNRTDSLSLFTKSCLNYVIETANAYLCNDTSKDEMLKTHRPEVGVKSVLCVPIFSSNEIIGTVSLFAGKKGALEDNHVFLLQRLIRSASILIHRALFTDSILQLWRIAARSLPAEDFLQQLVDSLREMMREPDCVLWRLDVNRNAFFVDACTMQHADTLDDLLLPLEQPHVQAVLRSEDSPSDEILLPENTAQRLGWRSALVIPMVLGGRPVGLLGIYSSKPQKEFPSWQRDMLTTFSKQASLAVDSVTNRAKSAYLNAKLPKITQSRNEEHLWNQVLQTALNLVGSIRGWITKVDKKTGKLIIVETRGNPTVKVFGLGEGTSGKALEEERVYRIGNVQDEVRKGGFCYFWDDTRSEIAIPIVVRDAEIRENDQVISNKTKPVGVLNVESPTANAFSEADAERLQLLANQAAATFENLDFDRKYSNLMQSSAALMQTKTEKEIFTGVMDAVEHTLGYEYINIALIDNSRDEIRTRYVRGVHNPKQFKLIARHKIDSNDIQAYVVTYRAIVVPLPGDPRLTTHVEKGAHHDSLTRVFIPIVNRYTSRVIGTLEAGYRRGILQHIYERDLQLLVRFIDYAVQALDRTERSLLERVQHELTAPTVSIRNSVLYMQRYGVSQKLLDDILLECELLFAETDKFSRILGKTSGNQTKMTKVLVFRDVVIMTAKRYRRVAIERKLDPSRIIYSVSDIEKLGWLYINPIAFNQVITNLFTNAFKYAKPNENGSGIDPTRFSIRISVDATGRDNILIKFQDWGIGIEKLYRERIFEKGYRIQDTKALNVTGSGYGLTIARDNMKTMGGNLILSNCYQPTEFTIFLPRSLRHITTTK